MDAATQDMNLKMIMDIPVDVHVEIGQTRLSIRDILRLGVSSVVELDRLAGQSADIVVNGKMIGQGDVVIVNETFGIRITKLVGVQDRIKSL
jgi:flagellar motor switch protein FliN/FliY